MKKIKLIHILLLMPISIILFVLYWMATSYGVYGQWVASFVILLIGIMILNEKIKNKEK